MLIGGHSFSHKLLKNLNYSDQKIEIEKNIKHLNSLTKSRLVFLHIHMVESQVTIKTQLVF